MRWSYFYLTVLLWIFTINVGADDLVSGSQNQGCRSVNSSNELLKCILAAHPDIDIQVAQLRQDEKEIDLAGQRPNPELDLEGIDNKTGGVSSEIALFHTFELGSKRGSRIKVARAQTSLSRSELLKTKEVVAVQTVLRIYRLRQIETELGVIRENLSTFKNIRARYSRTGRLNPEQQISVSVFKLAEEDNKLQKNTLISEKENILSEFRMLFGETFSISKNVLPQIKRTWPSITVAELRGADSLKTKNELDIAEAKNELAKSAAWPDLSIGPKVEFDTGQNSETRAGIALSMPLPFYNTNDGGRAKALLGVRKNALKKKWAEKNLKRKVQFLLADYKRSSLAVSKSLVESKIGSKHNELHRLIRRGVVSAPLIIEMHREIFEFYGNLHAQEQKAIESLWTLYAIRGSILKENLE